MLDALRALLARLSADPPTALQRAAAEVQAKFRSDATTRRGNVPQYAPGPKGSDGATIPITAEVVDGGDILVSAPAWCMTKAEERGQQDEWIAIVGDSIKSSLNK